MRRHRLLALVAASAASACLGGSDAILEPSCAAPEVTHAAMTAGSANVLSALATARVRQSDSAYVRFGESADRLDSLTPRLAVAGDSLLMPLFGLSAGTTYRAQIVAWNSCAVAKSDILAFETGLLPADLPQYVASGHNPSPGFVVFAAGMYGLAIDNTGRVVWYHRFPDGPGLNFQPQPNGRYVARPTPAGGQPAAWVEIDVLGRTTRTLRCAGDLAARMHDLLAESDGSYWLLCDELRAIDLSAAGGSPEATVMGTAVQRVSGSGQLLFSWSPFDHFPIDVQALQAAERVGGVINWTHGNSLDIDPDGNLLLSFRNLSEITKVDGRTGTVLWRMGGSANDFDDDYSPPPVFARQHSVRSLGRRSFTILDNLGNSDASRVYRIDYDAPRRVTVLAVYTSPRRVVAPLGGSVQALPNGHTLVSFGNGGAVEEYDTNGNVVWQLDGNPGYVFRAQRIRSLYAPGVGDPR